MIYTCEQCGRRYTRDFGECPNCGGYIYIEDEGTSRKRNKAQSKQRGSAGMNILSFLMPLFGFIFYGVHITKSPGIAKGCLKSAIAGICAVPVLVLLGFGIFQASKVVANDDIEQVQRELESYEFDNLYSDIASEDWCEISSDGRWMKLDTCPEIPGKSFSGNVYAEEVLWQIQQISADFGITQTLYEKIVHTTALSGVQSENYGQIEVTWAYDPDAGLEIMFDLLR